MDQQRTNPTPSTSVVLDGMASSASVVLDSALLPPPLTVAATVASLPRANVVVAAAEDGAQVTLSEQVFTELLVASANADLKAQEVVQLTQQKLEAEKATAQAQATVMELRRELDAATKRIAAMQQKVDEQAGDKAMEAATATLMCGLKEHLAQLEATIRDRDWTVTALKQQVAGDRAQISKLKEKKRALKERIAGIKELVADDDDLPQLIVVNDDEKRPTHCTCRGDSDMDCQQRIVELSDQIGQLQLNHERCERRLKADMATFKQAAESAEQRAIAKLHEAYVDNARAIIAALMITPQNNITYEEAIATFPKASKKLLVALFYSHAKELLGQCPKVDAVGMQLNQVLNRARVSMGSMVVLGMPSAMQTELHVDVLKSAAVLSAWMQKNTLVAEGEADKLKVMDLVERMTNAYESLRKEFERTKQELCDASLSVVDRSHVNYQHAVETGAMTANEAHRATPAELDEAIRRAHSKAHIGLMAATVSLGIVADMVDAHISRHQIKTPPGSNVISSLRTILEHHATTIRVLNAEQKPIAAKYSELITVVREMAALEVDTFTPQVWAASTPEQVLRTLVDLYKKHRLNSHIGDGEFAVVNAANKKYGDLWAALRQKAMDLQVITEDDVRKEDPYLIIERFEQAFNQCRAQVTRLRETFDQVKRGVTETMCSANRGLHEAAQPIQANDSQRVVSALLSQFERPTTTGVVNDKK